MEPNPYKFNETNPRIVLDAVRPNNVYYGAAVIFVASMTFYNRRFFRKDGNALNAVAFTLASAPASYSYANFFLCSAEVEAGMLNNENESKH